jgi:diguanylate cyclase (GGDEF)-like protein
MAPLLARREDSYAGADMANARRLGAYVWLLTAAACGVMLSLDPPTAAIGDVGWAVAGLALAAFVAIAVAMRRGGEWVTWNLLLVFGYLGLTLIVVLSWLAGGRTPPYHEFIIVPVIYTAATHPPRRAVFFLGATLVAGLLPLIEHGWSRAAAATAMSQALIWIGLGMLGVLLMERVRAQRIGLRTEGEAARQEARVDRLTGLGNRRAFDEAMETEVARSRRTGLPLSLVVIDIDDFKEINDRYGHLEGDRCLGEVAEVLGSSSRRPDSCFRWGGDEFVLLLTGTDAEGAILAGERLAEGVRRKVRRPGGGSMTIRFGAAQLERDMDADELLARADLALLVVDPAATDVDVR